MVSRFKLAIPSLVAVIALTIATISLQNLTPQQAQAEGGQDPGVQAEEVVAESEIVVPPWCRWNLNVPQAVSFNPVDENGQELSNFVYSGEEQKIQSIPANETYYVAGQTGLLTQAEADACSWFGEPEVGAGITFSMNGSEFQAYSLNPETGDFDIRDAGMDILLDSDNPMALIREFVPGCGLNSFTAGLTSVQFTSDNYMNDFQLLELDPDSVLTNNFCSATTQFKMKIPANLLPDVSDTRFAWFGPTITYTAVLSTGIVQDQSVGSLESQTVSFTQPANMTMVQGPLTLTATATSGLTVSFASSTPSTCNVQSGEVVQVAAGTCRITATQSGDETSYAPATPVEKAFLISKVNQTVTTSTIPAKLANYNNTATLVAKTNSTGRVTWSATVCFIVSGPSMRRGANDSNCILKLTIASDERYNSFTKTWTVVK